jgi:hypothetical protein
MNRILCITARVDDDPPVSKTAGLNDNPPLNTGVDGEEITAVSALHYM